MYEYQNKSNGPAGIRIGMFFVMFMVLGVVSFKNIVVDAQADTKIEKHEVNKENLKK